MKRVKILILFILILLTIYEIASTYSKYSQKVSGEAEVDTGKWIVKINNTLVTSKNEADREIEFDINQLDFPEQQNVAENKIAPGAEGYFDLVFDIKDCSVAVKYDVTIDLAGLDICDRIAFSKACLIENEEEIEDGVIRTESSTYTGTIELDKTTNNENTIVRFYFKWINDESGNNDENDTILGMQKGLKINIPIKVIVSQYSGENIQAYNESSENG